MRSPSAAAEAGSSSSASNRLRIGSRAIAAAAGSAMTSTSIMWQASRRTAASSRPGKGPPEGVLYACAEAARSIGLATSQALRVRVAANHLSDPDRRIRRRAAGRCGIVDQDRELLADPDGASAMFGMTNADLGEAMIHGPLLLSRGLLHLLLDLVEQRTEVEVPSLPDDPFGCEAPARPTDEVIGVLPVLTKPLGVGTRLHHVHDEPIEQLGRANVADHRIELGRREGLWPAHQGCEKAAGGVAGGPQLKCKVVLGLEALGQGAQMSEVHAMIIAAAFVGFPHLRIVERGKLAHDVPGCLSR